MPKKWKVTPKYLLQIKRKHCSWNEGCADCGRVCKPSVCKYFLSIVVPTWYRDLKRIHGKKLKISNDFMKFSAVLTYLKRGL